MAKRVNGRAGAIADAGYGRRLKDIRRVHDNQGRAWERRALAACSALAACGSGDGTGEHGAAAPASITQAVAPAGNSFIRGPAPTLASTTDRLLPRELVHASGQAPSTAYSASTIYYPTDAHPAPFAGVAFVPGFFANQIWIANWGPFLASNGIVTMIIDTNTILDLPPTRADALIAAVGTLKAENTRSGSPLEGNLDTTRMAIAGWSMGGGGALIAANAHPELKAVIGMCPWNPLGTYPMDTVPTLMYGGTADGLAGPPSGELFYASIPDTTPKQYYEVLGGLHQVADDPAGQNGEIGREGLSWLKVFLEGDARYKQFLGVKPNDASTFDSNQ